MKTFVHPVLGEVAELPPDLQPWKVWKHLLNPTEDWGKLTDVAREDLISKARANGCPRWKPTDSSPAVARSCNRCLVRLHATVWRDTYRAELVATTELGTKRHEHAKTVLSTPRGCVIVVQDSRVLTVYRPHPPGLAVPRTEAQFVRAASRVLRQTTGVHQMTADEALALSIDNPGDVWHLALAIADAETSGTWTVEQNAAVVERLAQVASSTREVLRPSYALFDALEAALDASDLEELEPVVCAVSDWLEVTERVHGEASARALLDQVADLIALAPDPWRGLQPLISGRLSRTVGVAVAWWTELDEVVGALALDALPVVHAAKSTLARTVAAPGFWARFQSTLRALGRQVEGALKPGTGRLVPAIELGGDLSVAVEARFDPPVGARVFVVDADHPRGEELTGEVVAGEEVWQLDRARDATWWVVVYGDVPGRDLEAVLAAVADRPDAHVEYGPLHLE